MDFSKLTFTKSPAFRIGFPPSERAFKLRVSDAFAVEHNCMIRNQALNAKFVDYGMQDNGSMIVEMQLVTKGGVSGNNPDGTGDGNGKEWKPSAFKWLPKSIEDLDHFLTQEVAVCVHEGRIFFDLSSVHFFNSGNPSDVAEAQAELDLEVKPTLLGEATLEQLFERIRVLVDE